jgi:serine/threonine-protein kinase
VVDSGSATQLRDPLVQAARSRVGQVLNAKYRLDRLLGIGGMAAVYAATHLRNANRVAVKVLHRELSVDRDLRARFLREGYAANTVDHPGTVRIADDEVAEDGAVFLVMELLDGETLDARWERCGRRLRVGEVVTLTIELLDILAAAHAKGIVHRDIKPENLFLTRDGRLKILDFGVARLREASSPSKTKSGAVFGTPAFMPPEQALGRVREVDALSDLWAVGATAFSLLTGRFVHEGETGEEMIVRAATTPVPPLASFFMLTIPDPIARVIDRALAFDRGDRWPSALAMKDALVHARDESILAMADDWGDGNEKTRLAPAPKMTLHPDFAAGAQEPTVAMPTLPAASTVGGVATNGTTRRAHNRRVLRIGGVAALAAATVGSVLAVLVVAVVSTAHRPVMAVPVAVSAASQAPPAVSSAPTDLAPAAILATDVPTAATQEPMQPPAAPIATSASRAPATAPTARATASVAVPANPYACKPPYTIDRATGMKHFKAECL